MDDFENQVTDFYNEVVAAKSFMKSKSYFNAAKHLIKAAALKYNMQGYDEQVAEMEKQLQDLIKQINK